MRASLGLAFILNNAYGAPIELADLNVRLDSKSWNTAIFGPYDPDEMDSQPLQYVLLEDNDLGFAAKPFVPKINMLKALSTISKEYHEPGIAYVLDFEANGFRGNETFALLQEGVTKCKLRPIRQLAPQTQDNIRVPPLRQLQATEAEIATTGATDFLGGSVDVMFITADQVKLTEEFFTDAPTQGPGKEHLFNIKGRFVQKCECAHSHLEDVWIMLGDQRFDVRKIHVKCPEFTGYKSLPMNNASESASTEDTTTSSTTPIVASTEL